MAEGGVVLAYCHSDEVSHSWHASMEALRDWDDRHEGRIWRRGGRIHARCGAEGLVKGRNQLARKFLEEVPGDWLFWLDTDMGFEPDTVDRLVEVADPVKRPIVGALCLAQKMPFLDTMGGYRTVPVPTIYEWSGERGFDVIWSYPADGLVACSATGAACVLIHRSVLERIAEKWGPTWYTRLPDPHNDDPLGEDLSFCLRARALDIPIHVHTGIKTTHHKSIWLNEQEYWNQLVPPPATEEVAVIVPTRGRPSSAVPFMASLRASSGLARAYAVIHEKDGSAAAWRAAGATVVTCKAEGWAAKCNHGHRATKEPWLYFVGDDVRFHAGWLDHALAAAGDRFEVVGTNDLGDPPSSPSANARHCLVSRRYTDTVGASWDGPGVVCHEGYRTREAAGEIIMAARERGVWAMSLGSLVEHLHPRWGKAEPDGVHLMATKRERQDEELLGRRWQARRAEPVAIEA